MTIFRNYQPGPVVGMGAHNNGKITMHTPKISGSFDRLVANNLVYRNGGTGIHAFKSNHIDIVNNTSYRNDRNVQNGEIGCLFATSDCNVTNNISFGSGSPKPCATPVPRLK